MASVAETMDKAGRLVRHALGAALSPIRAGDNKIASRWPETAGPQTMRLGSNTFLSGQPIPSRCTPGGQNVSPSLQWSAPPAGTAELVLICEDPDAPMVKPFVHWILHRLSPDTTSLPEGVVNERELPNLGGALQGENDAKTRGWSGPKPPMGHGIHHYHFQLFALDTKLNLGSHATLEDLTKGMKGHIVAEGELVGTYEIKGTA